MFQFFTKKYYLRDLLDGFIDIHCHILPGIDDGAADVNQSIALLKKYEALGIHDFIATPHIMIDFYPNNEATIAEAYEKLEAKNLRSKIPGLIINLSAEYMIDSHFEDLLEAKKIVPLKYRYVLVELSYLQPPLNLSSVILKMREYGYYVVLAHPERYNFYHNRKDYYKSLKQMGCFFQMNMLSLTDYYGKSAQKTAKWLLEENLIDFIGTDTHKTIQLDFLSQIKLNGRTKDHIQHIIRSTNECFKGFRL
ncbi:tyrosine-protein phosphatase [Ascidiimonas sp. W6]|uniref:tyrosine-protein phosphatase n=1 Tax=Ascidiimonas meishanensis TaxID=3128903 RepID=UPI0030EBB302